MPTNPSSNAEEEDDDFFGEEAEDDNYGGQLNSGLALAESRALEERFRKFGFHEAYDAAKEERLQDGFEDGYVASFPLAMEIGAIFGKAVMESKMKNLKGETSSSSPETLENIKLLIRQQLTAPNLQTSDLQELKRRLQDAE